MRWQDDHGFTLVELYVVIAVLAISTIPLHSALSERIAANEELIEATLATLVEAQESHVRAHGRFADSLVDLSEHAPGLVDEELAGGRTAGYLVELHDVDADGWSASASAAAPGVSGRAAYVVDETGVVRERDCRSGQVWDHGEGRCIPDPADALDPAAVEVLGVLDRLGWGLVLAGAAGQLQDEELVAGLQARVDADDDGLVGIEEILAVDPFAIAEDLVDVPEDPRAAIEGESLARATVDAHQRWLAQVLQPGVAGEVLPPGVPLRTDAVEIRALLDGVPAIGAAASLRFLADHVDALDVRPAPAGDMAHESPQVNTQRRDVLRRDVARMVRHLDEGMPEEALRAQLRGLRARADLDDAPQDWIVGPAATRIAAQVDATLRALGA